MDALPRLQIVFVACRSRPALAHPLPKLKLSVSRANSTVLRQSAQALPGEYDDNFHLTGADGQEYVLKLMHPAREHSFIDMQCQALRHLAQRAPHLSLPRVLPDHDGELFSAVTISDGSTRLVWLLTFVKGTVFAKVRPHAPELLGDLGRFLWRDGCRAAFLLASGRRTGS